MLKQRITHFFQVSSSRKHSLCQVKSLCSLVGSTVGWPKAELGWNQVSAGRRFSWQDLCAVRVSQSLCPARQENDWHWHCWPPAGACPERGALWDQLSSGDGAPDPHSDTTEKSCPWRARGHLGTALPRPLPCRDTAP